MRALLLLVALLPALASGQGRAPSKGGGGVDAAGVLNTVADAGTLLRADRDAYANTFVASNLQPDGGVGGYFFVSNNDGCAKMGSGSTSDFCVANNTASMNFSSVIMPTIFIQQPACRANQSCLFFSDVWGPGVFPRSSLPACASGQKGGKVTLSTDNREYFCDGTTAQRVALSIDNTASVDFASMAADGTDTQTMTLTGAATTDAVHCSPLADPGTGLDFRWFRVSAANTVTLAVRNASGGVLDPASLSMKCVVTR